MSGFDVRSGEANRWWQQNSVLGVLLNRLMLLFIFVPIGLVLSNRYSLSMVVFAFMIPYGFLVRYLAMRAVRAHLALNPDALEEFESQGIITS
jgi:phosphatidylglycerophosphate synthase